MIFRTLPAREAAGWVLAHTTRLADRVIQKGTVLDPPLVAALEAACITQVVAARLEDGDIAEDEAAARLGDALCGSFMARLPAGHGRANLEATRHGLLRVDAALIAALNRLDEGITIATLPDATQARPGLMLATIKIIPFAVPEAALRQAESLARAAPALRLAPFRALRVALVLSTRPGLRESVLQGTISVTAGRLAALGCVMLPPRKVAHDQAEIAAAFTGALADGADLLLFAGASAVVDRGDIGPAAIVAAGGAITHFGMPVDPGNLICLGRIAATPAIVMPGCARSPRLNGIDLILRLICAGEPAGSAEITAMGAGGLLQEARPRPVPRSGRGGAKPPAPRFAAIVLAAGLSSRMAPRNKLLLADSSGRAMVARVVAACAASGVDQVVIVLGHQADAVERVIQAQAAERVGTGPKLRIARAPNYRAGLSESLRAGIAALDSDITAAMICLGDMPLVTAGIIDSMLAAYDPDQGRAIVVPTCRGQRGNPVLWDRRFFPEIAALSGDTGARGLLRLHGGAVHEIELGTDAVLLDFDTPESLSGAGQRGLC